MPSDASANVWVPVARETFEYSLVPWFGRRYAPWLRLVAREHPLDRTGLVLVPEAVYRVFKYDHRYGARVTDRQLRQMGYPRHPAEAELADVRAALRKALLAGAYVQAARMTCQAEALQEQIDTFKQALRNGRAAQTAGDSRPDRNVSVKTGAKSTGVGTFPQPTLAWAPA